MLELKQIRKRYETAGFAQTALDDVSVAFRDNEFVAILGPSGSGKTTLLNIIGGLDRFDSGDLVIDGISTRQFSDRDWDAYRNNRIGFVFQSYNLIPHQTVLSNVELALTLSGVGRAERHRRALEALARVGLSEHANKRPSQLSGGQMQRVAIARALVNEPEILLADEPTGALDSKTSIEVMDLLKEVAQDRLVIMVTHNPELAYAYATRIVELSDGRITNDSDPFDPSLMVRREAKPQRRTSMSFLTALSLSFNNLMTKKGRTLMTAFAGSIGIIGIAAVLALATGANVFIQNTEEETLSVYPLTISSTGVDMTSLVAQQVTQTSDESELAEDEVGERRTLTAILSRVGTNDLASLKEFLDSGGDGIDEYANEINYSYDVTPLIFLNDTSNGVQQVSPDSSLASIASDSTGALGSISLAGMDITTSAFQELPGSIELFESQYDMCVGHWPEAYNELVLVLSHYGTISDVVEYAMGLRDHAEFEDMIKSFLAGEEITASDEAKTFTYDELMSCTFKLVAASDMYEYEPEYQLWTNKAEDEAYLKQLVAAGEDLHVVGIVQPKKDQDATTLMQGLYYTSELIDHVIDVAANSEVVQAQLANPEFDVLSGTRFDSDDKETTLTLESLISVDENKLRSAFTIDTSAFTLDLSGLDFSGITVDISEDSLPTFDASRLTSDLSGAISTERLSRLLNEALAEEISSGGIRISEDAMATLRETLATIIEGYADYVATHEGATAVDYVASSEVRAALSSATADLIDTDEMATRLGQRTAELYQTQIVPEISSAISTSVKTYLDDAVTTYLSQVLNQVQQQITEIATAAFEQATQDLAANLSSAVGIDQNILSSAFKLNMTTQELSELVVAMMQSVKTSYETNLSTLGYSDLSKPSQISIYPVDFDAKEEVIAILDAYNARMATEDESKIVTYSDVVGVLMTSVKQIVDMVSTLLIAFVSISLVVSSIMIAVITYISVLERKKEIGVLRSIGASKGDVSRVFNAETVIEGLVAGVMGVVITYILSAIANVVVGKLFGVEGIMRLSADAAAALIGISVLLTLLAGLIPSRAAAKADPVEALRSE